MSYWYRTEILKRKEVSEATLGADKVAGKQRSQSLLQFHNTFLIPIHCRLQFDEFKNMKDRQRWKETKQQSKK